MNDADGITTIFIVARSAIVRAGLESVLQTNEEFIVTGSAAEISAAPVDFSGGRTIDVILANVEREADFDNLLEFTSDNLPEAIDFPAIVALFPPELQSPEHFIKALRYGLRGMLPLDASADEIAASISSAAAGLFSFSAEMADAFISLFAENDSPGSAIENNSGSFEDPLIENLTPREAEILEMLGEGASNKSIASQLRISEHTVKFHVASIFGKLGVNTRTEAVTQALRRGLLLL